MRTSLVELLETPRLKLLPFTLELKQVALSERARLPELLGVAVPDAWPGADLLEALPHFIEAMEQDPTGQVWDGIILHKADRVAIGRPWHASHWKSSAQAEAICSSIKNTLPLPHPELIRSPLPLTIRCLCVSASPPSSLS